jgi:hypothetical protein
MEKKNCNHQIRSLLKEIDLFGTFITFRINNDLEYKSISGGCCTLFFIIFTLIYTLYYSYGFISRKNISYIYSTKVVESSPYINLKKENFNFAFGVQQQIDSCDYVYESEDVNFFNYSVESIEWTGFGTSAQTIIANLELGHCTKEDFYNQIDIYFENNSIETLYCPKINNFNYTLEGLYTDDYFKFLRINLTLSNYAMNHLDEVEEYLKKNPLELALYYIDTTVDYQSEDHFMSPYMNYLYRGFDLNFIKFIYVFVSPISFINDENLIFDNSHEKNSSTLDYTYDSFRYIYSRKDENIIDERLLGQIIIKASPKIYQFNRNYQKLPSFIADLCGILEEIMVITLIIINLVERKLVDHKLINRMLKFKGSKNYDVNHLIELFDSDKNSNDIMKIIKKPNLKIEKRENISSLNKSVIVLLNNFMGKVDKSNNLNNDEDTNDKNELRAKSVNFKRKKTFNSKSKTVKFQESENKIELKTFPVRNGLFNDVMRLNFSHNLNEKECKLDNENSNLSFSSLSLNRNKKRINSKKNNKKERLLPVSVSENFLASLCPCCSNLQRRRYEIIKKAENKIHYYLDIYTYIKKMQEIDLIKYCLFDNEQMNLFEFLSKPPIKFGNEKNDCIYQEFQENQQIIKKLEAKEMDSVFNSYNNIRNKRKVCFEDIKLLRLIKAEIDFLKN